MRFAVEHGVLISCVTRLKGLGLWTVAAHRRHVAAPHPDAKVGKVGKGEMRVHWAAPIVPRRPGQVHDSLENALAIIAQCQPFEHALTGWDSALNKKLVTLEELRELPFRGRAREVLRAANASADSGLESLVRVRLGWLRESVTPQAYLHGHRVDFLIGECLVLQIDGGHHVGKQRLSDNRHDAALKLKGYHVIRVGYEQVMHRWPEVERVVKEAIARGLHRFRTI